MCTTLKEIRSKLLDAAKEDSSAFILVVQRIEIYQVFLVKSE